MCQFLMNLHYHNCANSMHVVQKLILYILKYSNFEQMCHSLRKPCFSTHFDWSRPCGSQDQLKLHPETYITVKRLLYFGHLSCMPVV